MYRNLVYKLLFQARGTWIVLYQGLCVHRPQQPGESSHVIAPRWQSVSVTARPWERISDPEYGSVVLNLTKLIELAVERIILCQHALESSLYPAQQIGIIITRGEKRSILHRLVLFAEPYVHCLLRKLT